MRNLFAIFLLVFFAGCHTNKDENPVPVSIVSGSPKNDSSKNLPHFFRAMGAGQNLYIVKAAGQPATTIQYLFVSGKPFNSSSHEIDLILNDANNQTLFTAPLPFDDETFSQNIQLYVKQNEALVLRSTTDRFTFWAAGTQ